MLKLPPRPDRVELASFWLAFSVAIGLSVAGVAWLAEFTRWVALGLAVTLVLAVPGAAWPRVAARPYWLWNRLARLYARSARLLLTGICYYVVFVAVGRTGSALKIDRPAPEVSLWVARGTLSPTAYASLDGSEAGPAASGALARLLSWSYRSGHYWVVCLLPFLLLLRALEVGRENEAPAGTYPLY